MYFDVVGDINLIAPPYRTHPHLAYAAEVAERDVIEWFRRDNVEIGKGYVPNTTLDIPFTYIALSGYTPDIADCEDPDLINAIKYEVAGVLTFRFDNGMISQSGGLAMNPNVIEFRHDRRQYKFRPLDELGGLARLGFPVGFPKFLAAWNNAWKYRNENENLI